MSGSGEILPVDMWHVQEWVGLALLILFFQWRLLRDLHAWIVVAVGYFAVLGLYNNLAAPVFQMCLMAFAYVWVPWTWWRFILDTLVLLLVGDALWFIFGHEYGLFNHISFDTTIMACLLPWCLHRYRSLPHSAKSRHLWWLGTAYMCVAIVQFHGTTALTCMGLAFCVPAIWRRQWLVPVLFGVAACVVLVWKHDEFLSSTGRTQMWREYMTFWLQNVNALTGAGLGAFEIIGPYIPVDGRHFRAMHNDFLQVLFDGGIIGLVFFLGLWVIAAKKMFTHPVLLSFFAVFLVASSTYFPLHFFFSQLIVLAALKCSHWGDREFTNKSGLGKVVRVLQKTYW